VTTSLRPDAGATDTPGGPLGARYEARRGWVQEYFDRTASAAWARLTSDAPVSGVRATVRAGRDRMRARLVSWLPRDLHGVRVLDAGCGPGTLAIELAARGAHVVAVDLSPTLVALGRERAGGMPGGKNIRWHVGDMLDPALGAVDYVVAMDSVIHYAADDAARALAAMMGRAGRGVAATFAPATPLLRVMHAAGRVFPRGDRAPSIEPVAEAGLRRRVEGHVAGDPRLAGWRWAATARVASGFYTSQALWLERQQM
jgi:magnesium-protoporphyrin O-methyltransferase